MKNNLDFRCMDTLCPAQGYFYRKEDKFKPNVFTNHINYEEHSYTINNIIKDKMYTNKITELDFQGINGNKNLGHYFKILFLEAPCLMPIEVKEKFHDKFSNIDIPTKENDTYIRT